MLNACQQSADLRCSVKSAVHGLLNSSPRVGRCHSKLVILLQACFKPSCFLPVLCSHGSEFRARALCVHVPPPAPGDCCHSPPLPLGAAHKSNLSAGVQMWLRMR